MFYHASQVKDINVLKPHVSNHNVSLTYFSNKRENVLVYLSNAIEKYCNETNYCFTGKWTKWASYGFEDGLLVLEEYYPNATYETYKGVSGYIYYINNILKKDKLKDIPDTYSINYDIEVDGVEYIEDAYDAIMDAVQNNKIKLLKYEELSDKKKQWIHDTIVNEFNNLNNQPEYEYFLRKHFSFLNDV